MTDSADWIVLESHPARVRVSRDYVVLEDHWMPRMLEVSANGATNDGSDPETYARVEVNADGVPRLTELRLVSTDPDSAGIQQADLRSVQVSALVKTLLAGFTFPVRSEDGGHRYVVEVPFVESSAYTANLSFLDRRAGGRTSRDITPELLGRVAKVYRDNISGHPTKAVQHHFQVSQRMAAEYVSRARKRDLLPPTKRGKKQA